MGWVWSLYSCCCSLNFSQACPALNHSRTTQQPEGAHYSNTLVATRKAFTTFYNTTEHSNSQFCAQVNPRRYNLPVKQQETTPTMTRAHDKTQLQCSAQHLAVLATVLHKLYNPCTMASAAHITWLPSAYLLQVVLHNETACCCTCSCSVRIRVHWCTATGALPLLLYRRPAAVQCVLPPG